MGFKNFLFDFNSLIELNDYGGFINIESSTFTNINSCGAIIRNKRVLLQRTDISMTTYSTNYMNRLNNYQYELLSQKYSPITDPFLAVCS